MKCKDLVPAALDLLLGSCCACCGVPGPILCPSCRAAVPGSAFRAPDVGRTGPGDPSGWPVWAAAGYRPIAGRLVIAHKDRGAWGLRGALADLAAGATHALCASAPSSHLPGPLLVPVPTDPARARERGLDHARALASATARRTGLAWRPLLTRSRAVPDQVGLDAVARSGAQAGSMAVRPGPWLAPGQPLFWREPACVVVLDDVVTTGATARAAAGALEAVGHHILGIACVAQTTLRHGDRHAGSETNALPAQTR